MCGVAGILRLDGAAPDRAALERMSSAQLHRGPNDHGLVELGPIALAHRRLSIIDLSPLGHQPMCTPDRRLWITYNGEVYNHLELRAELEKNGETLVGHSDTEVILLTFRRHGLDAFERLNGMWALAIWDAETGRLVLSRDRLGVKPLHWARGPHAIAFASEAKALLAGDPSLALVDEETLASFVEKPSHVYGRRTFWRGIERIDPATTLVVDRAGRVESHAFWRFRPRAAPAAAGLTIEDAAAQVRDTLTDSIRLRFRADVPVGTCLSGGLDSSSIVALADHALGRRPRTYSVVYDDPEYGEGEFVTAMIDRFQLDARVVRPDGTDLETVLEQLTWAQDQPSAGPGLYSQWQVMKLAAPEVQVLLDGQGGDELYAGYYAYFLAHARTLLDRGLRGDASALVELFRSEPEIRMLTGQSPLAHLADSALRRAARRLPSGLPGLSTLRARIEAGPRRGLRHAAAPRPLLRPELRALAARFAPGWATPKSTGDALTDAQWDQLVRTSIPSLLHYEDRSSMAFAIEAREPYLDYRLVEQAFALPAAFRIRGVETKRVLREAMRGLLPESVRSRRDKKGFPTPFSSWIRGHARPLVDGRLRPAGARLRRWLDGEAIDALLDAHQERRADHGARVWQLLTLELFLERAGA